MTWKGNICWRLWQFLIYTGYALLFNSGLCYYFESSQNVSIVSSNLLFVSPQKYKPKCYDMRILTAVIGILSLSITKWWSQQNTRLLPKFHGLFIRPILFGNSKVSGLWMTPSLQASNRHRNFAPHSSGNEACIECRLAPVFTGTLQGNKCTIKQFIAFNYPWAITHWRRAISYWPRWHVADWTPHIV